jgi:hypothetical protein
MRDWMRSGEKEERQEREERKKESKKGKAWNFPRLRLRRSMFGKLRFSVGDTNI